MSLRTYGWSGAVTVFGAEPIPAYERPPLSKNALLAPEWRLVHPYSVAAYGEAGIDLRVGTRVDAMNPIDVMSGWLPVKPSVTTSCCLRSARVRDN